MPLGPVRQWFIVWSNSRRVVLCFLAFCALVCVGGVGVSYSDAVALRDHGIRTPAVVTAVHGGRSSYVTVRFTTRAGTTVTADVGNYDWQPDPQVGDEPTVVYDPDDPPGNVADVRMGPDFLNPWLLAAGAVAAAGAFFGTWTGRIDWARAARKRYGID